MTLFRQPRLFRKSTKKAQPAEKLIGERVNYDRQTLKSFLVSEQCESSAPPVTVRKIVGRAGK